MQTLVITGGSSGIELATAKTRGNLGSTMSGVDIEISLSIPIPDISF